MCKDYKNIQDDSIEARV